MQQQGGGGGKDEIKVALVVNEAHNTLMAYAPPQKMAVIERTIKLLDQPSASDRSLESYVAETLKEPYRDYLSRNDKTFQQEQQQQQEQGDRGDNRRRNDSRRGRTRSSDDREDEVARDTTDAMFNKGKLSIGVDKITNSLVISTEGEILMKRIVAMALELDRAARPVDHVRVAEVGKLGGGRAAQEVLRRLLGNTTKTPGPDTPPPVERSRAQDSIPVDPSANARTGLNPTP